MTVTRRLLLMLVGATLIAGMLAISSPSFALESNRGQASDAPAFQTFCPPDIFCTPVLADTVGESEHAGIRPYEKASDRSG